MNTRTTYNHEDGYQPAYDMTHLNDGPFDHIPEQNRPVPTGRTARHGGIEYRNPCVSVDGGLCVGDGKTARLMSREVWNQRCDQIEAAAAHDLLLALLACIPALKLEGYTDGPGGLLERVNEAVNKATASPLTRY